MPLILRGSKGSRLTAAEHDANLTFLEDLAETGGANSLLSIGNQVVPYVESGEILGIPIADVNVAKQYDLDAGTELGVEVTPATIRGRRVYQNILPVSNRLLWEWPGAAEGEDRSNFRTAFVSANTALAWADFPAHLETAYNNGAWFITNTSGGNVTISLGKTGSEETATWQSGVSNATLAAGSMLKVEWESWPTSGVPTVVCRHYTYAVSTLFDFVGQVVGIPGSPPAFPAHENTATDGTKWVIVGAFMNLSLDVGAAPAIPTGANWVQIPGLTSNFVNVSGNRMGINFAAKYATSSSEGWGTINTSQMQAVGAWVFRVRPAPALVTDLFGNSDFTVNNAFDTSVPWGGLTLSANSRVLVAVCSPSITSLANHVERAGFLQYSKRTSGTFDGNSAIGVTDVTTTWATDTSTFGASTRTMIGSLQMKDPATL